MAVLMIILVLLAVVAGGVYMQVNPNDNLPRSPN
jgi:uncharacterized protein YneF (UPF0154 family)